MFGWIAASWGLFFILFIATNPGVCGEQRAGSSRCKRPDPTVGIYTCHGMTPVISEPHSPLCHLRHQIPRVAADNKAARDAAFCSRRSPSAGSAPNCCCLRRGAPMEINEVFSDLRFAETQLSVCRTIKLFPHVTMKLPKFAIWFSVSYAALWASSPPLSHCFTALSPFRGSVLPQEYCICPVSFVWHLCLCITIKWNQFYNWFLQAGTRMTCLQFLLPILLAACNKLLNHSIISCWLPMGFSCTRHLSDEIGNGFENIQINYISWALLKTLKEVS